MAETGNTPLDRLTTELAAAPAPSPTLPEPHEGSDVAPASAMASKTDIPPPPELYVHEEATPTGPVIATQTEDEIAGEPLIPQPLPSLTTLWPQASPEERQCFVALYHEELRLLLAAWDTEVPQPPRRRTALRSKKPRSRGEKC